VSVRRATFRKIRQVQISITRGGAPGRLSGLESWAWQVSDNDVTPVTAEQHCAKRGRRTVKLVKGLWRFGLTNVGQGIKRWLLQ
jgi:hypothetical protein